MLQSVSVTLSCSVATALRRTHDLMFHRLDSNHTADTLPTVLTVKRKVEVNPLIPPLVNGYGELTGSGYIHIQFQL